MRKLATTALTALSITLMGSAAALAAPHQGAQGSGPQGSGYNQQYNGPQNPQPGNGQWNQGSRDDHRFEDRRDNDRFDNNRRFDDNRRFDRNRNFNFQLYFGNFDRWERGWGYGTYQNQYRYSRVLNTWQIERQLEHQGYYNVSHLQKARGGFGYRAFAFNQRGRPVMLRVNPYTGGVMDVRYI